MTQTEIPKQPSLPGIKSLIVFWLLFGLLGFFGPYLITLFMEQDYFVRWEKLVQAPSDTAKLVSGDTNVVYIQTKKNQVLSCNLDNLDECWIPDTGSIVHSTTCNLSSSQFSLLTHPPGGIVDCVHVHISGGEYVSNQIFALDQQGEIWRWMDRHSNNLMAAFFFAPLTGLIGVIIGSLVWSMRWLFIKRSLGDIRLFTLNRSRFIALWIMVLLPIICFISVLVIARILLYHDQVSKTQQSRIQMNSIYTSVASTLSIQMTSNAQLFTVIMTPDPAGPGYDFIKECSNAKWDAGSQLEVSCSTNYFGMNPFVDIISVQDKVWAAGFTGQALQFNLPSGYGYITGDYPSWIVKSADHFRATMGCPGDIVDCSVEFSLYIVLPGGKRVALGNWGISTSNPLEEIDVDLSRFAGQQILFELFTKKINGAYEFKNCILINPRIINSSAR